MTKALFISKILGTLLELGTDLWRQHGKKPDGVEIAKTQIRRIPDYWADIAAKRAEVDRELAELKAQGK
jgi:hypothetical protein